MRHLTARFAAMGSASEVPCPFTSVPSLITFISAITDEGVVTIAAVHNCPSCGDIVACAFCHAVMPMDGVRLYEHVRDTHDG